MEQAIQMARAIRVNHARNYLTEFSCYIDPNAAQNYEAEHLRRISEKLEAVERGEIKRLFVTCPPRHWKSSLCSEKFPTWYLSRHPKDSVILTSHSGNLALGFSRNVRDCIIGNNRYRELFPNVEVNQDFSSTQDWALLGAYRSTMRALGVGAAPTGRGANLIIIDDPIADNVEANSKVRRDAVWDWYKQTLRDRLDPNGAIVLIMSRWHSEDLAGRLMQASEAGDGEKWETLHMPAISEQGEALWPEKYPLEALDGIKKGVGSKAFAAKYQGRPRPDEGNVLDSSKFVMIDADSVPELVQIVRAWDLAFSDKQSADYLAGAKVGMDGKGNYYILHVKRRQGKWPDGKREIISTAHQDGTKVIMTIESNGPQKGYYQDLKVHPELQQHVIFEDIPEGNKEMRASLWGSRMQDGLIFCVRADWNGDFFDQCDQFPGSDHDDCVDGVSSAYKYLSGNTNVMATRVEAIDRREYGMPRYSRRVL
jgi:predicted phage terminase large subunit-like protein